MTHESNTTVSGLLRLPARQRRHIASALRTLACCAASVVVVTPYSFAADNLADSILGSWRWAYSVEDGRRTLDPRWTLRLSFERDGRCTCDSTVAGATEIHDARTGDPSSVPFTEHHELHGTFALDGTTMTLAFGPSELTLMQSCGFRAFGTSNASSVTVKVNATASALLMRSTDGKREMHFERRGK